VPARHLCTRRARYVRVREYLLPWRWRADHGAVQVASNLRFNCAQRRGRNMSFGTALAQAGESALSYMDGSSPS
jgi:hypothetical protein